MQNALYRLLAILVVNFPDFIRYDNILFSKFLRLRSTSICGMFRIIFRRSDVLYLLQFL